MRACVHVCVPTRAQDGRIYYYNAATQVTQWEMPADFAPAGQWLQTTRSLSLARALSLSHSLSPSLPPLSLQHRIGSRLGGLLTRFPPVALCLFLCAHLHSFASSSIHPPMHPLPHTPKPYI